MNISTSYRISFEELLRATRLGHRPRRQLAWVCTALLPVAAVLELVLSENLPVAAVGMAMTGYLFHQLTLGTHRAARAALAKITGTTEVELTEESVRIRRPGVSTEIDWGQYHKVVDTPEFLLLYINRCTFTAVVKNGLDTAERAELASFVASLNATPVPLHKSATPVAEAAERAGRHR
ncbi:YcxB family protein [Kitasatospora sp. NPDC054939]